MSAHRRRSGKSLLGYEARGDSNYGDYLGAPGPGRQRKSKTGKKGPTGPQQKLLARLCREQGIEYTHPPSSQEASARIASLLKG
jgi:hypothetical protein